MAEVLFTENRESENYFTLETMKYYIILLFGLLTVNGLAQECYDLSDRSSWIGVVCYEQDILLMQMQNQMYQFCGVDRLVFNGLLQAPDPSLYYNQVIRGKFNCQGQQSNGTYWTDPRGVRMYVPE